jgi:hypothetical protein
MYIENDSAGHKGRLQLDNLAGRHGVSVWETDARKWEIAINRFQCGYGRDTHKCTIEWPRGGTPGFRKLWVKEGRRWVPVRIDLEPVVVASLASEGDFCTSQKETDATQITAESRQSGSVPPTVTKSDETNSQAGSNSLDSTRNEDGESITIAVTANPTHRASLEQ